MPSIKDLHPDLWLKPHHLKGTRQTVTVERVSVEELHSPFAGKSGKKLVLSFHGKKLRLVLNKTQTFAMADVCRSDDYSTWIGHQAILSAARANNGKQTILISPIPDEPSTTANGNGEPPTQPTPAPAAATEDDDSSDDPGSELFDS